MVGNVVQVRDYISPNFLLKSRHFVVAGQHRHRVRRERTDDFLCPVPGYRYNSTRSTKQQNNKTEQKKNAKGVKTMNRKTVSKGPSLLPIPPPSPVLYMFFFPVLFVNWCGKEHRRYAKNKKHTLLFICCCSEIECENG